MTSIQDILGKPPTRGYRCALSFFEGGFDPLDASLESGISYRRILTFRSGCRSQRVVVPKVEDCLKLAWPLNASPYQVFNAFLMAARRRFLEDLERKTGVVIKDSRSVRPRARRPPRPRFDAPPAGWL